MTKNKILELTPMEYAHLREAVRYMQEEHMDSFGKLDPTLSRIQRKLGEEPHS